MINTLDIVLYSFAAGVLMGVIYKLIVRIIIVDTDDILY